MSKRLISTIDAHCEGKAVRMVTGGIPNIPGKTMVEKRAFFSENLGHLRAALNNEPRGHESQFVVTMTPPVTEDAAFGIIFMPIGGYPGMCGHSSIGVATMAVEMGIVEPKEPVTEVVFDTPAGIIRARVKVENGKAKSATIRNVPSFLIKSALIKVPSLGEVPVEVSYGGDLYGIIEASDMGVNPTPDDLAKAEDLRKEILDSINQQVEIKHPDLDFVKSVHSLLINDKPRNPKANVLNISDQCRSKKIDRSPCGTGTSAKMAALWAKGELKLGETYVTESIIGGLFYGELIKEVKVGNIKAVVPEITGTAFLTGIHTFILGKDDPFRYGFTF